MKRKRISRGSCSGVALGEEVTITKAGKPVARLVPAEKPARRRRLGWAAGEFVVPDDFDAPQPAEIEESFQQPALHRQ